MAVTETRTYRFSGSFSRTDMWWPVEAGQVITDIQVGEEDAAYVVAYTKQPGTYWVSSAPNKKSVTWFYRARDEERTFVVSYVVHNAVTVYEDKAVLRWQFIGPE